MWYVRASILTMWYAYQNNRKLQFMVFRGQKSLNPWQKEKTKCVSCMGSYSTCWEPTCTTLHLRSHVALLGTELMNYSTTHQTIIQFSPINKYHTVFPLCIKHMILYSWYNISKYLLFLDKKCMSPYLQCTSIGPLPGTSLALHLRWKLSSAVACLGTPLSGHDTKCNCFTLRVSSPWNIRDV